MTSLAWFCCGSAAMDERTEVSTFDGYDKFNVSMVSNAEEQNMHNSPLSGLFKASLRKMRFCKTRVVRIAICFSR